MADWSKRGVINDCSDFFEALTAADNAGQLLNDHTYGTDAKLFQDAAIIVWAVRRALIDGDGVLLAAVRGMACMEPPTTYMDHVGREIERTGSHPARYGVYFAEDGAKVAAVIDFLGLKHERSN